MFTLIMTSLILWLVILLLPWHPWGVQETLDAESVVEKRQTQAIDLTILIPARNEEDVIKDTLSSLDDQLPDLKIILIDDQSTDETVQRARELSLKNLRIIHGKELPEGWSGKLWVLEQGLRETETELILLLDADIKLRPGTLQTLLNKLETDNLDFVSLMAQLKMENFWEKLLMPAFIYFFKLLYPFKLSNNGHPLVAAGAGGCILLKKDGLESIGGFASLKSALIDDCTLARSFREQGRSTWIGLTHSAISLRSYDHLSEIWNMVARTAYTQLRYSPLLLLLCTGLMILAYVVPLIALFTYPIPAFLIIALILMTYLPTVSYYNLNPLWIAGLPLAGFLYLLMTWTSTFRYYRGERSQWKGRSYS